MEKLKNYLKLTYYTKGKNNNWYCDYYFYNGKTYEQGTTKATGYGYDKQSTSLSNAINKYKHLYKLKRGIKWESETSARATLKNKGFYGIYKDKSISYGIGVDAVINCLSAFSNVKIIERYNGTRENYLKLEITTNEEQ